MTDNQKQIEAAIEKAKIFTKPYLGQIHSLAVTHVMALDRHLDQALALLRQCPPESQEPQPLTGCEHYARCTKSQEPAETGESELDKLIRLMGLGVGFRQYVTVQLLGVRNDAEQRKVALELTHEACDRLEAVKKDYKQLREWCEKYMSEPLLNLVDKLTSETKRADAAEHNIKLLKQCDDSSTKVIGEMDEEIKRLKDELALRK